MVDTIEFSERIYNLVNGFTDPAVFPSPESEFVENAFLENSLCTESYNKVLDAYERLCIRLHSQNGEDADVEIILNEMNTIMKHISLKMFQHGVFFARRKSVM